LLRNTYNTPLKTIADMELNIFQNFRRIIFSAKIFEEQLYDGRPTNVLYALYHAIMMLPIAQRPSAFLGS